MVKLKGIPATIVDKHFAAKLQKETHPSSIPDLHFLKPRNWDDKILKLDATTPSLLLPPQKIVTFFRGVG
jgi:hypothetical protein